MSGQKKFYQMNIDERLQLLKDEELLTDEDLAEISGRSGLTENAADHMTENVIGIYSLPIGLAQNFIVNGRKILIPMVIEEPSVIAAASNGAKMAAAAGGFFAQADDPCMIGQMQLVGIKDLEGAQKVLLAHKDEILNAAGKADPMLKKLGGGPKDLIVRPFSKTEAGPMLILHLIIDVRDAMGANAVNTALEKIAPIIEKLTGGDVRLRILSNLADHRLARSSCTINPETLASKDFQGTDVRDRILEAAAFAEADPYRAATHNKGIMNGIDALTIATGNDWRAVESGAYAWASVSGKLSPLSHWKKDEKGNLCGFIELPLALGTIGGATHVHPGARAVLKLMGVKTSRELAEVAVSLGLAQNLAALKALSTEGIQRGHMKLHARQIAMAVGAEGETIDEIAAEMIQNGTINLDAAQNIFNELKNK